MIDINGTDVLLLANTGTDEVPVWTVVGSQRDVSFDESNDTIDLSNKSSRATILAAGRYSSTVSLDALYVPSDTAYSALKDAMRNGDLIKVQRQESAAALEEAEAIVTSLSEAFPDQGEATVSISLSISGTWTPSV